MGISWRAWRLGMRMRKYDGDGYGDQEGYRWWLFDGIEELRQLALKQDGGGIRAKLKELVPEYTPQQGECVL